MVEVPEAFKGILDEQEQHIVIKNVIISNSRDNTTASQPFSLGPRACLGRKPGTAALQGAAHCADMECSFAYMEMSLILAKLHFRYDLQLRDRDLD